MPEDRVPAGAEVSLACEGAFIESPSWISPPYEPVTKIQVHEQGGLEVFLEGFIERGPVSLGVVRDMFGTWGDATFDGFITRCEVTNGHFLMRGLQPGRYKLLLADSSEEKALKPKLLRTRFVQVLPGGMTTILMTPARQPWVQVHGRVLCGGDPLADVELVVATGFTTDEDLVVRAKTDSMGAYSLDLPGFGDYAFSLAGYGSRRIHQVQVKANPFQRDFHYPTGSIEGTVILATGSGYAVARRLNDALETASHDLSSGSKVSSDGHFSIQNLEYGEYLVSAYSWGPRGYPATVVNLNHMEIVTISEVNPTALVELQTQASQSLVCQVLSPGGLPLVGATVLARPAARGHARWQDLGRTDKDGFVSTSIVPHLGLILLARIHTLHTEGPGWTTGPVLIAPAGDSVPTQWALTCESACTLIVTLRGADQSPGKACRVALFRDGRLRAFPPGRSNRMGPQQRLEFLAPGSYTFVVTGHGGIRHEGQVTLAPGEVRRLSVGP